MLHGSNFYLNSELTDFLRYASSFLVLLSWTLEQKSSVIMEHLQIMSFSTTEMEASFFILFSLVEL